MPCAFLRWAGELVGWLVCYWVRKDAVEGKTVGIRRSYVLLDSDADFLCDLGEVFFNLFYLPTSWLSYLFRLYWQRSTGFFCMVWLAQKGLILVGVFRYYCRTTDVEQCFNRCYLPTQSRILFAKDLFWKLFKNSMLWCAWREVAKYCHLKLPADLDQLYHVGYFNPRVQ